MVRRVVLVGLLAVGLLIAGGYLGWSGGYSAGLAAEGEVGRWGDGFPGALFFGIAFLFKAFLALMVVSLIAKLLFFRRWHTGHWGHRRHGHGRGYRHGYYDWHPGADELAEENVEGDNGPQVAWVKTQAVLFAHRRPVQPTLRWASRIMEELILVVDDEPKVTKLARDYLEQGGFRVTTAVDGKGALDAARRTRPDLVVLDLGLPGMDGLDVCRALRRESDVPIIMLTARVEETDRLIGLEIGADDYITKPFSPRELVARVRAIFRRVQGSYREPARIRAGDIEIDLEGRQVTRMGLPVPVTPIEFSVLATLAGHPGRTFTRGQLLDRLHDADYEGFDRSIDSHIKNLRRKIETTPSGPRYILTMFGVGYKFSSEV